MREGRRDDLPAQQCVLGAIRLRLPLLGLRRGSRARGSGRSGCGRVRCEQRLTETAGVRARWDGNNGMMNYYVSQRRLIEKRAY